MTVLLPDFVASSNWFLMVAWIPIGAAYLLMHPHWSRVLHVSRLRPDRDGACRVLVFCALFASALLGVLGVGLEGYHTSGCPNSVLFQSEIESLARFLYEFCDREKMPFWVTFGNLLFVMRQQHRIPVGDTDSDIAMDKSVLLQRYGSVANFTSAIETDAFQKLRMRLHITFREDRDLLQIYTTPELHGAHADIWFYTHDEDKVTGAHWLVNADRTIRAKRIPYDEVYPLEEHSAFFLSVPVSMPHNPAYLAQAEYGANFMQPLVTRLECIENVWNGYTFYKADEDKYRWTIMLLSFTGMLSTLLLLQYPFGFKHHAATTPTQRLEQEKYFV